MSTAVNKTLSHLLSRYKGDPEENEDVEEIVLRVSREDLAKLGEHTLRSAIGFLEIVTSKKSERAASAISDTSIM